MVQVPTFQESNVQELRPTPINPKSASTFGEEVIDLSEGIGAVADHLKKVEGATAVRNNLTAYTQDAINIHNSTLQNPDTDKAREDAQTSLEKSMNDRAASIGDPEARDAFLQRASGVLDRNFISINSSLATRQVKDFNKSMTTYGDGFVSDYANLSRPDQMKASINDFSREVDVQGKLSGQDPNLLNTYKKQYIYKAKYSQASHDIDLNPQMALKQLQAGDKGMHSGLTTTDRDKLINRAQSKIERDQEKSEKLLNVAQKKNLDDAVMKQTIGGLTDDKAEEMYYQKQISQKGYDALIKNGTSPHVIDAKTDPDKYLNSVKMLLDPKVSEEDKRTSLINLNSDGKIATSDMKHLYQLHLIPNKGGSESISQSSQGKKDLALLDKAEKQDQELMDRRKSLQGSFDRLMGHSDDPHNVSDLLQQLHMSLSKEQNITPDMINNQTTQVINKDNLNKNPSVVTKCRKDGSICIDAKGNKAKVYPDGHWEPA